MLTVDDYSALNNYDFNNSPESCSGNSFNSDYTDLQSDEDFMQQLSSDLNIPLLLNPGEDEINLLNSIFDQSPDELMSEITAPSIPNDDYKLEIFGDEFKELQNWDLNSFPNLSAVKSEDSSSCSDSIKSNSPTPPTSLNSPISIKDEIKNEPLSPQTQQTIITTDTLGLNKKQTTGPKLITKRIPIQPKTPYVIPNKKQIIALNNNNNNNNTSNLRINPVSHAAQNVVLLENIKAVPLTNVITPAITIKTDTKCTSIPTPIVVDNHAIPVNIDPKILKRQQRKIKNRESACLSRKKKKDYLTSLENQIKDLTAENRSLKLENTQLKERLSKYEGNNTTNHTATKNIKNSIVLCMFLLTIGFNLENFRLPFSTRNIDVVTSDISNGVDHHNRHLLWSTVDTDDNSSNFLPLSMCPAGVNQTESARLALELERWIGKPNQLTPSVGKNDLSHFDNLKNNTESKEFSPNPPHKPRGNRKRKKKFETRLVSFTKQQQEQKWTSNNNEIQVFAPTVEQIYSEFFEAINRQDDTFYVVSLSDHHLLLPALHHNKTRRPKMSLIMPSMISNGNQTHPTHVPLMQIDCEVLDTRLIQIRYGLIPQHLRANGNTTNNENVDKKSNGEKTNYNYTEKKAYKPYFIKKKHNGIYNLN